MSCLIPVDTTSKTSVLTSKLPCYLVLMEPSCSVKTALTIEIGSQGNTRIVKYIVVPISWASFHVHGSFSWRDEAAQDTFSSTCLHDYATGIILRHLTFSMWCLLGPAGADRDPKYVINFLQVGIPSSKNLPPSARLSFKSFVFPNDSWQNGKLCGAKRTDRKSTLFSRISSISPANCAIWP